MPQTSSAIKVPRPAGSSGQNESPFAGAFTIYGRSILLECIAHTDGKISVAPIRPIIDHSVYSDRIQPIFSCSGDEQVICSAIESDTGTHAQRERIEIEDVAPGYKAVETCEIGRNLQVHAKPIEGEAAIQTYSVTPIRIKERAEGQRLRFFAPPWIPADDSYPLNPAAIVVN